MYAFPLYAMFFNQFIYCVYLFQMCLYRVGPKIVTTYTNSIIAGRG